jgi:hypothetical protein
VKLPLGLRRPAAQRPGDARAVVLLLRSDVLSVGRIPDVVVEATVEQARAARDGGGVVVALVLRVHGSAFGLPNPGLLPTARERKSGQDRMTAAIRALKKAGVQADGEILITRRSARAVARLARRRGAGVVLVEPTPAGRVRRFLEGDPLRQLNRALAPAIRVAAVGLTADG